MTRERQLLRAIAIACVRHAAERIAPVTEALQIEVNAHDILGKLVEKVPAIDGDWDYIEAMIHASIIPDVLA